MEQQNERRNDQHGPTSQHNESQKFTGDSDRNEIRNENTNPSTSNSDKDLKETFRSSEERQYQDTATQAGDRAGIRDQQDGDQPVTNNHDQLENEQDFKPESEWNKERREGDDRLKEFGDRTEANRTDDTDFSTGNDSFNKNQDNV